MPDPILTPIPTHQEFYDLAQLGVVAGIAIASLLAVVLGMYFIKAVW